MNFVVTLQSPPPANPNTLFGFAPLVRAYQVLRLLIQKKLNDELKNFNTPAGKPAGEAFNGALARAEELQRKLIEQGYQFDSQGRLVGWLLPVWRADP